MVEDDSGVPSADWFDALTTLIGNGLSAVRVTKNSSGLVTIIWRNPPIDADKAKATQLIGAAVHSW